MTVWFKTEQAFLQPIHRRTHKEECFIVKMVLDTFKNIPACNLKYIIVIMSFYLCFIAVFLTCLDLK